MTADASELPEEGLSLWLTEWKVGPQNPWPGRHIVASIGRAAAGQLDFSVHPEGLAVKVAMLRVHPDFQRRGLAGVMMDALYAAYPTAWINHGWRTKAGSYWWNGYREPAPERNVHNRPPAEWAAYFDAVDVAADKAHNAHQNAFYGLDGHRDAVYRYGERLEGEAALHAASFREAAPVRVDPAAQPLHGAARLVLPPAVHDYVHDRTLDGGVRAAALLEHLGHGNLPRDAYWNSTRQAAFADAHHEELFTNAPPGRPATHVVFTLRPLDITAVPDAHALAASVAFRHPGDLAVEVTGLSWRQADRPYLTHTASFTPAVEAAIAPPLIESCKRGLPGPLRRGRLPARRIAWQRDALRRPGRADPGHGRTAPAGPGLTRAGLAASVHHGPDGCAAPPDARRASQLRAARAAVRAASTSAHLERCGRFRTTTARAPLALLFCYEDRKPFSILSHAPRIHQGWDRRSPPSGGAGCAAACG